MKGMDDKTRRKFARSFRILDKFFNTFDDAVACGNDEDLGLYMKGLMSHVFDDRLIETSWNISTPKINKSNLHVVLGQVQVKSNLHDVFMEIRNKQQKQGILSYIIGKLIFLVLRIAWSW
jgi:hypothetical protein